MKTFYKLLINTSLAAVVTNFLWFAIVFWAYLETKSVLATSIIGGSYMLLTAFSGMFFGTFVDHHKKKVAMLYSSLASLAAFGGAGILYAALPASELLSLTGLPFWLFVGLILMGAVAASMRYIAIATTVTLLVPEDGRDKANGLVGTATGLSFTLTSVFSGLAIGFLGMGWSLAIGIVLTALTALHLLAIELDEPEPKSDGETASKMDVKGALKAIGQVPGLMALLLFATFNNFLGGVFMSLMDPYALNLVSVQVWGVLLGVVSFGFILGGLIVAKRGLGKSPLRTLFLMNILMWSVTLIFPLRSSIILLAVGMLVYMTLIPVVEAAEQTIIQKVVPYALQGRVFGFGQSLESAASPITAFLIGPIAQFWVIPFMTDGGGANTIGRWFGTGPDRGMALIFLTAGAIGLVVTILAMSSRSYRLLDKSYKHSKQEAQPEPTT